MPASALDAMTCHRCGGTISTTEERPAAFRVEDALCPACGAIQPPDLRLDHFARLGVPARVHLDAAVLSRRFRELSRELHPDRFARSSPRERRLALEHTTLLNDAHRVLRDPVKRAEYLLATRGVRVEERARGDEAFLLEVMELREEIEETLPDPVRRQAMVERLEGEVAGCLATIQAAAAASAPGVELPPDERERARSGLVRLKYMASALADLRSRIERQGT